MFHNLSKGTERRSVVVDTNNAGAYQTATGVDGGAVVSAAIDTDGYHGCVIQLLRGLATNAHVIAVKLQGATDSAFTTPVDLTSTITVTDVGGNKTNRAIEFDVYKPKYRYLRLSYQRTVQNSAIDRLQALLYRAGDEAVTQTTGTGGSSSVTVIN